MNGAGAHLPQVQGFDFDPKGVYTRKEVAEALRVSEMGLLRAEKRGELQSRRVGRAVRYTGQMVLDFLNRERSRSE